MALSVSDKAYYEEKLSLKNFYYLLGVTIIMAGIVWPLLLFVQDALSGLSSRWNLSIAMDWSMIGMMLGTIVSLLMYLGFKFLLSMGWLPSRRDR
jgi:hypothetical protein